MDTEQQPHLDEALYKRFEEFGAFQAYEYMGGDQAHREQEKSAFLAREVVNPNLDYPKIDPAELDSKERELLALKRDIVRNEPNPITKQAYCWKINEKIAELRLLRATKDGDMRRFKVWNRFVYGEPSREMFAYSIQRMRDEATALLTSEDPDIQAAAQDIVTILDAESFKELLETPVVFALPSPETFAAAQKATHDELDHIVAHVTEDKQYDAEEIRVLFEQALIALGADGSGWVVVVDKSGKKTLNVNQELKQVQIPEKRKMSQDGVIRLILHEIGTHVARRVNGERSRLKLLGLGLDRYERGEEGVTTLREQVTKDGMTDFSGYERHLAVGLAMGVDGTPRDFRGTFDILVKYYLLKSLKNGTSLEEAIPKARTTAWDTGVRTFRGTDCHTPGVCFTKDMIYREGNIAVWDVIGQNPDELMRLSVGKYDPSNPRHIWLLTELGITDEDLASADN